jgi:hypothetical protein
MSAQPKPTPRKPVNPVTIRTLRAHGWTPAEISKVLRVHLYVVEAALRSAA